ELVLHYIACMKAGLVATPCNYRYVPAEIDHALEVSGASVLIAHAEREQDVAASKLAGRLPRGVVRYGAKDRQTTSFESLVEQEPAFRELPRPDPSAPAFIFFTSGSTGPSKGVTHSLETTGWIATSAAKAFELSAEDIMMPGSSIAHIGGILFSFAALSVGVRVVVARTWDPEEVLELLRVERPTVLCMLPAALFAVVRDHGATRADFDSLRLCRSGSDKVPLELEREFTDLTGHMIDEGYGCTETGMVTLNPPSGTIKIGSIGRANPGYMVSVRSENGTELPPDREGRLWVRSHTNMIGYWSHPEATAEVIKDGWFDTGDLMRTDGEGYFWFCGRKKQIIVHDSLNICPQEVEDALLEHAAVESAGVIGIHDLVHGENVRAYITLKEGAQRPTVQELIRFARARVGYKAPEMIFVLDKMPLNPTGKVDRIELKRMAAEHTNGTTV
ncbi:MAG TPA: class I adenylate-forming enzyme family protein, partial [Candidatus Binatia bacterium]|nr:class I adenylate-forming enzyme family protein [Candidatus Binatia bacterium]